MQVKLKVLVKNLKTEKKELNETIERLQAELQHHTDQQKGTRRKCSPSPKKGELLCIIFRVNDYLTIYDFVTAYLYVTAYDSTSFSAELHNTSILT